MCHRIDRHSMNIQPLSCRMQGRLRTLSSNIVELEKRKNQIHDMLEEVMDSEALKKWEAKEDGSTN